MIGSPRHRTLAVARLHDEAFAADPQRSWDLTGHRYRATCSAQVGCGRGADVDGLDAEQQTRWGQKRESDCGRIPPEPAFCYGRDWAIGSVIPTWRARPLRVLQRSRAKTASCAT
jgi:hypothetical protein